MSDAEKQTQRTEAFSDGVFAIAITLLVLELKILPVGDLKSLPINGDGGVTNAHLLHYLSEQWHHYLAFFLSFTSILVMWVNHHRIFNVVRKIDDPFIYWNGFLLMFITLVPFPTGLLAEYMDTGAAKAAAGVYSGMGLMIAFAYNGLWHHAIRGGHLLAPGKEKEVNELTRQYRWGPVSYAVAFALSFVSAPASIGICLGLVVFFALRSWTNRK